MKHLLKIVGLILMAITISCSDEDAPKIYKVTVEVTISTDDDAYISGIGVPGGVYFQRYLKRSFTVEGRNRDVTIECDNPKALISLKVWVDKKLVKDEIGNSYMNVYYLPLSR